MMLHLPLSLIRQSDEKDGYEDRNNYQNNKNDRIDYIPSGIMSVNVRQNP